jgi:hypothetical protein
MVMGSIKLLTVLLTALVLAPQSAPRDSRIYGRVTTSGGDVFEGYIRWDRNEGSWADLLNGTKEIPWEFERQAERLDEEYGRRRASERSIRFMGIRISWDEDDRDSAPTAASGLRFGHLRSLEVRSDRSATAVLKSGQEVELSGGSTDIGRRLRGLVIDDPENGRVELRWRDLEVVDFMSAPEDAPAPESKRLYGTLRARGGEEFTGFVAWDTDEILESDILDGEEGARTRKIPFRRIDTIRRAGPSGARVVLRDGEEVTLRGSNDVNDDNRGITVSDPSLGQVTVAWDSFDELRFTDAPAPGAAYSTFDGGGPLYGTVETEEGDSHTGFIRWDNDEQDSWEILDGEEDGIDFDIEFGQLSTVEKRGSWGAEVTLLDGRRFVLEESNDVNADNKGIFITFDDGETVLVPWRDFERVTFER